MRLLTPRGCGAVVLWIALVTALLACQPTANTSSGIDYPTGAAVAALGVTERCDTGGECARRAEDIARAIIEGGLEGAYQGGGVVDTSGRGGAGTLVVSVDSDPPLNWSAATQAGPVANGRTSRAVIDLGPLLVNGVPYAVVDTASGPRRFAVSLGLADQLLDALYVRH